MTVMSVQRVILVANVFLYNIRVKKLQSDKCVECSGSCNECVRRAIEGGGNRSCKMWFESLTAFPKSSSSAESQSSSNVGRSGGQ